MAVLNLRERRDGRAITMRNWNRHGYDYDKALAATTAELEQKYGMSPVVLALLIDLAVLLLKFWISRNVTDPGPLPMIGEPGGGYE